MKCRKNYRDDRKYKEYRNAYKRRRNARSKELAINNGKKWTSEEIKMLLEHKIPDSQLAVKLSRSLSSINVKRATLKRNSIVFFMYADIRFNRPVDKDKDHISPGGYEFIMNGNKFNFDFEEYSGTVDPEDNCLVHMKMRNTDYESFPIAYAITERDLKKVSEIPEFFVDTYSYPEDEELKAVSIESCCFVLPYKDWEKIEISKEVLEKAEF